MKNCMFQYAKSWGSIYEDTWLITYSEAEELWKKYYPIAVKEIKDGLEPQMVIWGDCENETDYGEIIKEVDFHNCEVIGEKIYKITKTLIEE